MRKIIIFLVIICAGVGAAYTYRNHRQNGKADAPEERAIKVERGPIRLAVSSTGRVVSNLDVEIKCKASGQILSLPYDVSDFVEKGALLVELDPVDEDRRVKQAEVSLSSSKARLAQARQNLETAEHQLVNDQRRAEANLQSAQAAAEDAQAKANRMKQLLESERVSQEECETAQTAATRAAVELENANTRLKEIEVEKDALEIKRQDVRLAEAQEESDQIALDMASQRLKETKVYAPIQGCVADRTVQIGQIISSPMNNVGGGTALLTLSDLSRIFILASVDESDIGQVKVDQPVLITADAFPNRRFQGSVVRIATRGVNVSNVVTFEVKIEVLGRGKESLKPEMTANVEIIAAEKEDAFLLPAEAVFRKGPRFFVQLPGAGESPGEVREVETGIDDGVQVEIVSGLNEGDEVMQPEGVQSRWAGGGRPGGPDADRMRRMMMMRGMGRPRR